MVRVFEVSAVALALTCAADAAAASNFRKPGPIDVLAELHKFDVVRPALHGMHPMSESHHTRLPKSPFAVDDVPRHAEQVTLELPVFGETLVLELTQSRRLFAADFSVSYSTAEGVRTEKATPENCHYQGHVKGEPSSLVTASTCDGLDAVVKVKGRKLIVIPVAHDAKLLATRPQGVSTLSRDHGRTLAEHVVFDEQDMKNAPAFQCGHTAEAQSIKSKGHPVTVNPSLRKLLACDANTAFKTYKPPAGCTCKNPWSLTGYTNTYCNGECGSPDGDDPWCFTTAQCAGGANVDAGSAPWAYCKLGSSVPAATPAPTPRTPAPTFRITPAPTARPVATPAPTVRAGSPTPAPTRSSPAPTFAPTAATPVASGASFAEMLIAVDNELYKTFADSNAALQYVMRLANSVQGIYRALNLNVEVVLRHVHIFETQENTVLYTAPSDTIENYLNKWSAFRAKALSGAGGVYPVWPNHDEGMLLTGSDRSGSTTGLAWVNTMCSKTNSAGVSEATEKTPWQFVVETVAHEMGHNWGMAHDSPTTNGCPNEGYIMESVGCSNCPFTSFSEFSACSKTVITNTLQSLKNTPSNCLANDPGPPFGTAELCGDGYVFGSEQCDLGVNNGKTGSFCAANCKFATGVQCVVGACCNTATGKFKTAGTLCRDAMHQCDLADTCSGTGATCATDLFKADGTPCTEAGPGSECRRGSCLGWDNQCTDMMKGYTGTWLNGDTSFKCREQVADPCESELTCSNVPGWCQDYTCPANYKCTVNGKVLTGPITVHTCQCTGVQNNPVKVYAKDGTPCGTGKVCVNRKCQLRSMDTVVTAGALGSQSCEEAKCSSHGSCAQDLSLGYTCSCDPGYMGDDCSVPRPCSPSVSCASLNREECTADNVCGMCKTGFRTVSLTTDDPTTKCTMRKFEAASSFDVSPTNKDKAVPPTALIDGDSFTHFKQSFEVTSQVVSVVVKLDKTAPLARYELLSANGDVESDPRDWTLYGSSDCVTWTVLDARKGVEWAARHLKQTFLVKSDLPVNALKLVVTAVTDADTQNRVTLTPSAATTSGTEIVAGSGVTAAAATTKVAMVSIAEFAAFYAPPRETGGASSATTVACSATDTSKPSDHLCSGTTCSDHTPLNGAAALASSPFSLLAALLLAVGLRV